MLKRRLEKLEREVRQATGGPKVYFADEDTATGVMDIQDLNFSGPSREGRKLMEKYPNCTFIVDDIPRSSKETPGVQIC